MEHLRLLREEVSALRDTRVVSQRDFLQLQDDVLALRHERSAMQPGVDVLSMDQVQNDLLAMRSELAGEGQWPQHQHGAHQPLEVFDIERSLQTNLAAIPRQMDKLR